ncbi:MAG: hypothetical protein ACYCY5_09045 [Sulfuricella sp.]
MDIKAPAPNKVALFFMKSLRLVLKSSLMAFSWIKKQNKKSKKRRRIRERDYSREWTPLSLEANRRWSAQI